MTIFSELQSLNSERHYVLDSGIELSKYVPVDLSIHNALLQTIDVSSSQLLGVYIDKQIKGHDGMIGFGGYFEPRSIYSRSTHFNKFDADTERNIHLGIDLWCAAGTPVYAPLDGIIHSFKNNTNYGDYGPTIILQHTINETVFYTLFGHLSLNSIKNIEAGQAICKGDKLAELGDALVNGDYPPHLHFQIINDLQGYEGDYPGVCSKNDLDFYLKNCPNPEWVLKLQ